MPSRTHATRHRRILDELRGIADAPPRAEDRHRVEGLITDAAAMALDLEREQLLIKRRARAALLLTETDPTAAREARELSEREVYLERDVAELRTLMGRARRRFARGI